MEESWVSCPFCGKSLIVGKRQLGTTPKMPISIASIKTKFRSVVCLSLFLFVLVGSYLFSAFNPNTTLYGWVIIPAVAGFFAGYIIAELHTACMHTPPITKQA